MKITKLLLSIVLIFSLISPVFADETCAYFFYGEGKVYVGVSAGSNIAGPDIETCVTGIGDENTVGMKNTVGLNVVDFVTIPHYEHKDEEEIKKWEEKVNYKLVRLTDDQAILVRGDKTRIIE